LSTAGKNITSKLLMQLGFNLARFIKISKQGISGKELTTWLLGAALEQF